MSTKRTWTLEELWTELQDSFTNVLTHLLKGLDRARFMYLYSAVFDYICTPNAETEELYNRVINLLKKRASELVKIALSKPSDEEILDFFCKQWNDWTVACKLVDHIMAYMNRTWVKNQRQSNNPVFEIKMMGAIQWRDSMFQPLKDRLTRALLALIQRDRNAEVVNIQLIRDCTQCYADLGLNPENPKETTLDIYKEHFEAEFLTATELYYTIESTTYIDQNGVCSYMMKVERRLEEEQGRVDRYLDKSTKDALVSKLDQVLIEKHKEQIWSKFPELLAEDKLTDLALMYTLLSRISEGLEPLKTRFEAHVKSVGQEEIQKDAANASEKPQLFVEILLRIFRKYTEMIKGSFKGDAGFVAAMDKAFRDFVNNNAVVDSEPDKGTGSKAPHILAKYCDLILKKGPGSISDETLMEATQTDIVSLFKYLSDKDVFMMVYSKLLSKRLISDISASEDAESAMITKLKTAQGFEYCMKLQRMIQDMAVSKDINTNFQEWCSQKETKLPCAFNIFVLATGSWPLQAPNSNFNIPAEVATAIDHFKRFYESKYQGRKLTYLHHMSRADVDNRVVKGKIFKLTLSTYQMGVLLLFNQSNELTKREIQDATSLLDNPLKVALLGMVKTKIIDTASEDAKTWGDDTKFLVNMKLASKKLKINCNVPVMVDDKRDAAAGISDVSKQEIEQDRVFKLRAAVVRIMKARKTSTHNELVAEATQQVSRWFTPRITTIKKVIEYLIDQDYLKRVQDENNQALKKYEYVA